MFKVIVLIIATFIVFAVSRGILSGLPDRVDDPLKLAVQGGSDSTEEKEKIESVKGEMMNIKDGKLSFSYPIDWVKNETHGSSTILIARKNNNLITVRKELGDFSVVANQEKFMLSDAMYDATGLNPKSISEFTKVESGKNTFYTVRTGRGKGLLSYSYYLISKDTVYILAFISKDYDWRNEKLNENEDETYGVFKSVIKSVVLKK